MGQSDRWPNHRAHVNKYGGKYPFYCSVTSDTRATARSFVRTLNILLKFVRLYEFGHVRTAAQFEAAWKELRAALDESGDTGLLLRLRTRIKTSWLTPSSGPRRWRRKAKSGAVKGREDVR